ncbi:uncharacterized protein LOC122427586 isoform X3 [Cervus canadensis]|uniref:uncharacterized protein LOC122427586 isoform X3 n=1 Tax=Cervus canadensis TaxID=1574408 RepID=UPI001CA32C74|nr:uncharacterized protein LOC122427586 isoform X3 [Cervus canadensis]
MATYPPRRLLGARPLPSDPRRDPRRSDFPPGGGGRPRNLRCLRARFEGPAARHHHFLRRKPAALSWDIQTACGEACVPRNKLSQPTRNQSLWTTVVGS